MNGDFDFPPASIVRGVALSCPRHARRKGFLRPLEARSYSLPRGGCFARLLNHRHTSSTFGRQHPKRRLSHDTMHNRFVSCTRDAVDVKSKFTSCRKTTSSTPAWDHLHLPRSASCQLRAWTHVAIHSQKVVHVTLTLGSPCSCTARGSLRTRRAGGPYRFTPPAGFLACSTGAGAGALAALDAGGAPALTCELAAAGFVGSGSSPSARGTSSHTCSVTANSQGSGKTGDNAFQRRHAADSSAPAGRDYQPAPVTHRCIPPRFRTPSQPTPAR